MAITSQIRESLATGEAKVEDWQDAGLIKPSVFKPLIATIEK
jgi:mRNA interferase MazF